MAARSPCWTNGTARPPVHHTLFDHPHVVLSPHLTGMTRRAEALTFAAAARGVVAVLTGEPPVAVANPEWRSSSCVSD